MYTNNNHDSSSGFQRDVYCLFGLPVDNLSLSATKTLIRQLAPLKNGIVLSTININWVSRAAVDPEFYSAIINSDFVTIDGKPLLWLAKLLGYPMRETVPGSTLIQELLEETTSQPLTIFLFGGDGDVASLAMERINQCRGGLRAVGALNPGYGAVDEMSSDRIIDAINNASPDILLVALGACKGLEWIEKNRNRLKAGIISHLGATINFLAGTVRRAPRFVQEIGLEWVWRILQEPKLFSRYAKDGFRILPQVVEKAVSWYQCLPLKKRARQKPTDICTVRNDLHDEIFITFGRNLRMTADCQARELFKDAVSHDKDIVCDFKQTEFLDGAFIGLLLILDKRLAKHGQKLRIINLDTQLWALFRLYGFQHADSE